MHDVSKQHIEQALIEAINEKLGGLKQNALALLKKTVRFLISGIVEGYEEEVRQTVAVGKERGFSLNFKCEFSLRNEHLKAFFLQWKVTCINQATPYHTRNLI